MSNFKLLSPSEAAKKLRLSVRRVQKLCEEKRLGQLVGSQYVIPMEEIERFKRIPRVNGRPRKTVKNSA